MAEERNPPQRPMPQRPMILLPTTSQAPKPKPKSAPEVKDGVREVVETVVFVVVLVLLLKTFLAEAFVIPTGSMADTLYGYHKETICEKCGYRFRVNASEEAENNIPTEWGICPNCRYKNMFPVARRDAPIRGGGQ